MFVFVFDVLVDDVCDIICFNVIGTFYFSNNIFFFKNGNPKINGGHGLLTHRDELLYEFFTAR